MKRSLRLMLPLAALLCSASVLADSRTPPPPTTTQWIKANDVHLRYELTGKGPTTLVLMHEMSTSLETWDYVLPELARNHRVLRYDLRGFGLSQRIRGTMTMDDEMADLRNLLAALDIRGKVTLIGGAIGGAIALKYAATYPEQVDSVIAISPAAYMQARTTGGGSQPQATAPPAGAAPLDPVFPKKLQEAHPERVARFLAIQSSADPASSAATTPAAYAISYSEVLPRIQCPALIVATSLWMRPPESFKELADAIPNGRFAVVETGHFAALESPELLTPVLTKFLAETGAKR
jgi:3-oxoadipate enol-lactonase